MTASCGGVIDPSKNTVTPFSGTLAPGAQVDHRFTVDKNGEVIVTMTSVAPTPSNGSIGVGLAQAVSTGCSPLSGYISSGVVNRQVQFGLLNKGQYCVLIFDPGILTGSVSYAGTVSHP